MIPSLNHHLPEKRKILSKAWLSGARQPSHLSPNITESYIRHRVWEILSLLANILLLYFPLRFEKLTELSFFFLSAFLNLAKHLVPVSGLGDPKDVGRRRKWETLDLVIHFLPHSIVTIFFPRIWADKSTQNSQYSLLSGQNHYLISHYWY